MPSKLGHLVKLVPVAIGGTYSAYPSFLPTEPKDIKSLFEERKCYVVAHSEKSSGSGSTEGEKYLLACRTYPVGKTLDFFYFDTSSKSKIAIPVKYLKLGNNDDSGGGQEKGKKLDLDFIWGNSTSFEAKPFVFNTPVFDFELRGNQETGLYLINLCKETEIGTFLNVTNSKQILKCMWNGNDGKEWGDFWKEAEKKNYYFCLFQVQIIKVTRRK
ncbi:hypothetical protein WEN_01875 [Mycoplasma wenyonii str. Massachusetts]|uniref:Uncharacterized protein n=1 Tax=Mycoplasma wenyonii (strain Massachusetts) TaxID=1197325 RepID=I6Z6F4_MYCWM|nr:hypothetical protein [Mycoplasma wenyonii]AFN65168.1 hypothetical protein WEN_01875 [Mycoplasma wenyonii str. Massachusetts]